MSKVLDFNVLNEEITKENVLSMAEAIAFTETQYLIGYIGTKMQKLHSNVYWDIAYKNDVNHTFSDGYDLVQEEALFLSHYVGNKDFKKVLSDLAFRQVLADMQKSAE